MPHGHQVFVATAAQFGLDKGEELVVTWLHHLGQGLARQLARWAIAHARHLDGLASASKFGQGTGVADLDFFGVLGRGTQGHGDVVGHLVASNRDDRRVADGTLGEDGDVGGAATDVHQAHAQLFFIIGQYRVGRSQLLEDDVVDFQAAAAHFSMFWAALTAQVTT